MRGGWRGSERWRGEGTGWNEQTWYKHSPTVTVLHCRGMVSSFSLTSTHAGTFATRVHTCMNCRPQTGSSGLRGGCVMEENNPVQEVHPKVGGG